MDNEVLLTDGELRAKLTATLKSGFVEHGNMFVPTTELYNKLHDDEGLKVVFVEFCRWLGIKPGHVKVQFGSSDHPLYSKRVITIDHQFVDHPYICGALLAFAAIQFYCDHFDVNDVNDDFFEFASIEIGLGIWVINSLRPKLKRRHALYHSVKGKWVHKDGLSLHRYTPELYAHNVSAYAHNNHVLAEEYLPGVDQAHRYLLPDISTSLSNRTLPEPTAITKHRKAARQLWIRYLLVACIVASVVTFGIFFWYSSHPASTKQQSDDEQALKIIKTSLDSCLKKAADQQNSSDPNDLFMDRQIDSTKSRCQTLRNEYNYAVRQYESQYNQQ